MMKKILIFAVVLTLLVPSLAMAAAEFTLGGFVKLDSFWDSTQEAKNMQTAIQRDNTGLFHHGRTKFTAQGSRFNFTIKGPKVFGAQSTGFLEIDFDSAERGVGEAANNTSRSYTPRLRHAMFRFNWPETELLFGQYWSMFCEWYPELVEDGPFMGTGSPTARLAQIRLTQKFLGWGTAALLIGDANSVNNGQNYSTVDMTGESGFAPQVQGKLQYQQDLWGKAAYYGKPTPFTAKVTAGWQRDYIQESIRTVFTYGQNTYGNTFNIFTNHQSVDPWMIMGTVFVPVIPTASANLAGTASLMTQWWVGQGVEAFGLLGTGNYWKFKDNRRGNLNYEAVLQTRFGGQVQGQYYFDNQWFLTLAYGLSKNIGLSQSETSRFASRGTAANGINQPGYVYAFSGDLPNTWQQAAVAVWYRPIQAIKFGLQYAYGYTSWFQIMSAQGNATTAATAFVANPVNTSNVGNAHRVEFVGFFYF